MVLALEDAQRAISKYRERFNVAPTVLAIAPGRINLIGEHTDYQDGFVFPAAIDQHVIVAAGPGADESILHSITLDKDARFRASNPDPKRIGLWPRYAAGMAWAIQRNTGTKASEINAVIDSTLPAGSGLSSSAAMEMAFGTLWRLLDGLPIEDATLARLGQECENEFVGMRCGIMDQTASLFGVEGCALFVDTLDPGHPRAVRLPEGIAIVVCDTRAKHQLAGGEYNERRSQTEEAARILDVQSLRFADLPALEHKRHEMANVIYRRARHVITENSRALEFSFALADGDYDMVGELLRSSHASLRDDFEVSCHELDVMSDAANAHPSCIGARMTGGGFGGSCVALVRESGLECFISEVTRQYQAATGLEGKIRASSASKGASASRI